MVGWGSYYPLPEPVFGNDDESKKNSTTGYSNFNKAVGGTTDAGAFYCDAVRITDFKRRTWCTMQINSKTKALGSYAKIYPEFLESSGGITKLKGSGGSGFDREKHEMILVRPKMMALMSSAILCTKPGKV